MSKRDKQKNRDFTKTQPKDGDIVLHCGHLEKGKHHFMKMADGAIPFCRPDGSLGMAGWIVICDDCFKKHGKNIHSCIRGDAVWKGDAPIIEKNPEIPEEISKNSV